MENAAYELTEQNGQAKEHGTNISTQDSIQLKINYKEEAVYRESAKRVKGRRSQGEKTKSGLTRAQIIRVVITIFVCVAVLVIIGSVLYKYYISVEDEVAVIPPPRNALELQKYGPANGDKSLNNNTNIVEVILRKKIPLFSTLGNTVYISRHGFISLKKDNDKVANLSKNDTILAVYSSEMSHSGEVYYREILDDKDLREVTKDLINISSTYNPIQALLITYANVSFVTNAKKKQTFQVVLTSDGNNTYAILYYKQLDTITDAVAGFFEQDCNKMNFATKDQDLSQTSNTGKAGAHIYLLTNYTCMNEHITTCEMKACPRHLECSMKTPNEPYCDCITTCENQTSKICASDQHEYDSLCKMHQAFCLKYGPLVSLNVTRLYHGECKGVFPYGLDHGDAIANGNIALLHLSNQMPLFSSSLERAIYIYKDGYITVFPNSTQPVRIPNTEAVIIPYMFSTHTRTKRSLKSNSNNDLVNTGKIFYRQTNDSNILQIATSFINESINEIVNISAAVIVTFVDIPSPTNHSLKHTYQVFIASNLQQTFLILNYLNLDSNGALSGYYSTQCNYKSLVTENTTARLVNMSNIQRKGFFLFQLNKPEIDCPKHLQCQLNARETMFCGCKTCSEENYDVFCGTDGKSYANHCTLDKMFCENYGNKSTANVTKAYSGNCSVMYPFGLDVGHKELPLGVQYIEMTKPMVLFSQPANKLLVNAKIPFLTPYAGDTQLGKIYVSSNEYIPFLTKIYYMESFDKNWLQRASHDISEHIKYNFTASHVIVITYEVVLDELSNRSIAQVVLASNGKKSYTMFNYKVLQEESFFHGIFTNHAIDSCLFKSRGFVSGLNALNESNTNVNGRYIYLISPFDILCPSYTRCSISFIEDPAGSFECRCKRICQHLQPVCGNDGVTYESKCHLEKIFCERYGINNEINITVAYSGPCNVFYPFGSNYGDSRLLSNESETTFLLSRPMLLFTNIRNMIVISRDGMVRTDADLDKQNPPTASIDILSISRSFKEVLYREIFNISILQKASNDIMKVMQTDFSATQGIIVTFQGAFNTSQNKHQFVIVSDNKTTYSIFNSGGNTTFVYLETDCNSKYLTVEPNSPKIHKLSNYEYLVQCPSHLACFRFDNKSNCDCRYCLTSKTMPVCGTDGKTYSSKCELDSESCYKFGPSNTSHVQVAYSGNCSELQSFGLAHGDQEFNMSTDITQFTLHKEIPLFSSPGKTVYISRHGFISTVENKNKIANLSKGGIILAPYSMEMSQAGKIYYREIIAKNKLAGIAELVSSYIATSFDPVQALIVTYVNMTSVMDAKRKQTFQVVLTSDGNLTYGIFNYKELNADNATVGFYERDCNQERFVAAEKSRTLLNNSNGKINGTYVYLLTNYKCENKSLCDTISCPEHLECQVLNRKPFCRCIKSCINGTSSEVCSSEYVTYSNECVMNQSLCNAYGYERPWNVTLLHRGICRVFYEYGIENGDKKLLQNESSSILILKRKMLFFTNHRRDRLVISRTGLVGAPEDYTVSTYIQVFYQSKYEEVLYRETFSSAILQKASNDVNKLIKTEFNASQAIIVTFNNVLNATLSVNLFQFVIVSDNKTTYLIINSAENGFLPYAETNCNADFIYLLANSRKVLQLSNHDVLPCPTHLTCKKINDKSVCGCKICYSSATKYICGTDGKTYKNQCELDSKSCEKFGASNISHIQTAYNGNCTVTYQYGLSATHQNLSLNYSDINLKTPMLLFSENVTSLKINRLERSVECYTNHSNKSVGAIFGADIFPSTVVGDISYDETTNPDLLQRASYDISKFLTKTYRATQLVVITFSNIHWKENIGLKEIKEELTFQVVLISDGQSSYAMLNYGKVKMNYTDLIHLIIGADKCSQRLRAFMPGESVLTSTNTNLNGSYVYEVSSLKFSCPNHLQCTAVDGQHDYSIQIICACKTDCSAYLQPVCGTDKVTYKSLCHLQKSFCERFGNRSEINITVSHNGSCDILYEYGEDAGDNSFVGDDDVKAMILKRKIPLFSTVVQTLYINTNGLISTIKDSSHSLIIPYNKPIVAGYVADLYSDNNIGKIYYRQTFNSSILRRISTDVKRLNITDFQATSAVIVTYKNVVKFGDRNATYTFQIVIASNDVKTFGIFNYKRLDQQNGTAAFYDSLCNYKIFANQSVSLSLTNTSNVDIKGRYVYQLSRKTLVCPDHLTCRLDADSQAYCGCFTDCSSYKKQLLCGSDHVTYDSECELTKTECETFGNNTIMKNKVAYLGECKVLYPYKSVSENSRGEGDDDVFAIDLEQQLTVFGQNVSRLYVNTNGFVTLTQSPGRITSNYDKPIIYVYYHDFVSNATKGGLFIRNLKDQKLLYGISADIKRRTKSDFNATTGVIFTFEDVFRYGNFSEENSFQVAIVSDNVTTYGVFNYAKLQTNNSRAGYYSSECNREEFMPKVISKLLAQSSNVGIIGRHVYLLSQTGISCPAHLKCQKDDKGRTFCGCHKQCAQTSGTMFCGSDHRTYASSCHLWKDYCEKYGNNSVVNVTKAHDGDCKSRYPFGKQHQDKELFGDDISRYFQLSREIPLFTQLNSYIHINTNGFLTITLNPQYNVSIPYNKNILAAYAVDLDARKNAVFYRETFNATILSRADEDVRRLSRNNFTSKHAIIVTYDNIPIYGTNSSLSSFQTVLVTDFNATYVILNYFRLDVANGTVGFYENLCNYKLFTPPSNSTLLTETSNVGVKGRHVYLLTSFKCPLNLECKIDDSDQEYCGCISNCSTVRTTEVCSTNRTEYPSSCEFNRVACELYGIQNVSSVSYLHQGKCQGFYPFKFTHNDKRFYGDDEIVSLTLGRDIPLLSRPADRIYINSNGFISMISLSRSDLTFPIETSVITGYGMDLDSTKASSEYIWYRKTGKKDVLNRVNNDVKRISDDDFAANIALIVTFEKSGVYNQPTKLHDFQIILASNGNETYGIFIYERLDLNGAVAGFYENNCNFKMLSPPSNSKSLTETSNCGVKGMHILRLTNLSCYQSKVGINYTTVNILLTAKLSVRSFQWKIGDDSPNADVIVVEHVSGVYASILFGYIETLRYLTHANVKVLYSRETSSVVKNPFHFQVVFEKTPQNDHFQYGLIPLSPRFKCISRRFNIKLASKPSIKVSFMTNVANFTHANIKNTSVWLTNVSETEFSICYVSAENVYLTNVSYIAISGNSSTKATEHGAALFKTNEMIICKKIYFRYIYTLPPSVFTSQEGYENYDGSIQTWIKTIHSTHFELCAKNRALRPLPRLHNISVFYIVNGVKDACNNITCPIGLECRKATTGALYCDCITNCSSVVKEDVCGTDFVTYKSACDLHKSTCELYGAYNKHDITIAHRGKCIVYPMQTGKTIVNNTDAKKTICQDIALKPYNFHPTLKVSIIFTLTCNNTGSDNKLFYWVERVTNIAFTVCIKTASAISRFVINWLAYQSGFKTYTGGRIGTGEINVDNSFTKCVRIQEMEERATHTLVAVQRLSANLSNLFISAWVKYGINVEVCAKDFSVSTETTRIQVNWITLPKEFLPFLTELSSVSYAAGFTETCKTLSYNRNFPSLPNPVILSAAIDLAKGEVMKKIDTWLKAPNDTHLTVCRRPISQTLIPFIVLPTLCEDGWEYAVNKCWKKGDGCHNFNDATQTCVLQNSSLAVPANIAENFLIGQYFPNNSIWVGLNDRKSEGDWVTNENDTSTYQNWMIGKPDGGNLENCATLRHANDDRKWDDLSCSTCNKYVCSKDVAFEKRGGCNHECLNGGKCTIRNFKTACLCAEGFMGSKCDQRVSDVAECNNYTWHNETSRKLVPHTLNPSQCDKDNLTNGWHRFGAATNSKLAQRCPNSHNYCGVMNPGWLYGDFPTTDDGIVERNIHFFSFYCSDDHGKVKIRNCGNYFTYKFNAFPYWSCDYGICIA